MDNSKHAALYIRVSTDAQREEGYSIEAQQEMLKAYCVSRGILRFEYYTDGGFSGSNIDRPEMTRLILDIKGGKVSHVVVYKLDRLSRSQKDTLYLIEDVLIPNGVSFVSLNENMDTSTPIGRAMLGIMSAFAQLERETIKERTRMGMKERVKNGFWPGGGKIPYGYDYDSKKGILVPNSDSDTVRLMYKLYLDGWSMMAIARHVGLKYERLAEQILKRRTNCGYIIYNGEEFKGKHDPIISEEIFELTQRKISERSRGAYAEKSLLSGLIYCGVCGSKMRYQKWGRAGYKIYCYSQDKGKEHLSKQGKCDNNKVWAYELENEVLSDLFTMAQKNVEGGKEDVKGIDELLVSQANKLSRKLKNLYNVFGDSGDETLLETINEAKKELDSVKRRIEECERQRKDEESRKKARASLKGIEDAWDYMTLKEKQNVLRGFIEKIVVTYDKIDIYYKIYS